jgi:hypothetical protein
VISSQGAAVLVGQTIAFCRLPFPAQRVVTRGPLVEWASSLPCRHFWRHFFFGCGLPLCVTAAMLIGGIIPVASLWED